MVYPRLRLIRNLLSGVTPSPWKTQALGNRHFWSLAAIWGDKESFFEKNMDKNQLILKKFEFFNFLTILDNSRTIKNHF